MKGSMAEKKKNEVRILDLALGVGLLLVAMEICGRLWLINPLFSLDGTCHVILSLIHIFFNYLFIIINPSELNRSPTTSIWNIIFKNK